MKKFVFILSFVFALFLTNASFASTENNTTVDENQIVLTETNEIADVSDALVKADPIIIIIITDDTIIIIIIE